MQMESVCVSVCVFWCKWKRILENSTNTHANIILLVHVGKSMLLNYGKIFWMVDL